MNDMRLLIVILLPALFAALAFIAPARVRWLREGIALLSVAANTVLCALLFGRQSVFFMPWGGFGINFSLRLYGFSAQTTLDLAQKLYEQHKLISYPRTDSRHLSASVAGTLGAVVAAIEEPYRDRLAAGTGQKPLSGRFVDDSKVTDHHAIIPTPLPNRPTLAADERKIYDLICRRLLMAWHDDHVWAVTTLITAISPVDAAGTTGIDRYHSSGTAVEQVGWKILEIGAADPVASIATITVRAAHTTSPAGSITT